MGLFTRRAHNGPAATNGHAVRGRHEPYSMATRPTFGQWLRYTWLDLLTMVAMGALGLGVSWLASPCVRVLGGWQITDEKFFVPADIRSSPSSDPLVSCHLLRRGDSLPGVWVRALPLCPVALQVPATQIADLEGFPSYPLRKEIVPIWLSALLSALIPIFVFCICQFRVRSFWDLNNAIIGLLYSLITAAVFQVFLKWLIGGLRPHFLDVCKPDISLANNNPGTVGAPYNGAGFKTLYYTREICTGDINEIDDSLESFPSGHTTAAFGGFVFLYLYLNAKLKVFSNYHPAMWKLIVIYAPILGATLIGGALTIDEFHNWYDILAGAVIGTTMAFSAYRMTYAAIWDWRWNHIPLSRAAPFAFGGPELADAVFTRRVGWGTAGAGAFHEKHHHHHNGGGGMMSGGVNNGVGVPRKAVGTGPAHRGDDMV